MLSKLDVDDSCSRKSGPIAFTIQGQHLELDMADYTEHDGDGCRLLFQSISSAEKGPALVLGLPFLRKYMAVFDVGQKRLGLARANHDAKPGTADAHSGIRPQCSWWAPGRRWSPNQPSLADHISSPCLRWLAV